MNNTIDAILQFSIPDEMRAMTPEEYAKFFRSAGEEKYGFYNEEKHTILTIVYKKRPVLLGRAASAEAVLRATERRVRKQIQTYKNTGYGSRCVDGVRADTFRFAYTVQNIEQTGEYVLCRFPRYNLCFQLICREEHRDFATQKFEALLASVKFKGGAIHDQK